MSRDAERLKAPERWQESLRCAYICLEHDQGACVMQIRCDYLISMLLLDLDLPSDVLNDTFESTGDNSPAGVEAV